MSSDHRTRNRSSEHSLGAKVSPELSAHTWKDKKFIEILPGTSKDKKLCWIVCLELKHQPISKASNGEKIEKLKQSWSLDFSSTSCYSLTYTLTDQKQKPIILFDLGIDLLRSCFSAWFIVRDCPRNDHLLSQNLSPSLTCGPPQSTPPHPLIRPKMSTKMWGKQKCWN